MTKTNQLSTSINISIPFINKFNLTFLILVQMKKHVLIKLKKTIKKVITRTSLSKKQLMCFLIWIPPPLTSDPSFSTTMPTRTLVELPISN